MSNILIYKDYRASIVYDANKKDLHGSVEDIKDDVFFETDDLNKIEEEFHNTIDEYIQVREDIEKIIKNIKHVIKIKDFGLDNHDKNTETSNGPDFCKGCNVAHNIPSIDGDGVCWDYKESCSTYKERKLRESSSSRYGVTHGTSHVMSWS